MDKDYFDNPNLNEDVEVTPGFDQEPILPTIDVNLEEELAEKTSLMDRGEALWDGLVYGKDYAISYSIGQKLKHMGLGHLDEGQLLNAGELKEKFNLDVEPGTTMTPTQAVYAQENKLIREENMRKFGEHFSMDSKLNAGLALIGMFAGNMADPAAWYSGHAVGAVLRGGKALFSMLRVSERVWKTALKNRHLLNSRFTKTFGMSSDDAIIFAENLRKNAITPATKGQLLTLRLAEGGAGNLLEEIGVWQTQKTLGYQYPFTSIDVAANIFMPSIFHAVGTAAKGARRLGVDWSQTYAKPFVGDVEAKLAEFGIKKSDTSIFGADSVGAARVKPVDAAKTVKKNMNYKKDTVNYFNYDKEGNLYTYIRPRDGEVINITHVVTKTIPKLLKQMGIRKYEQNLGAMSKADVDDVTSGMTREELFEAEYNFKEGEKIDESDLRELVGDEARADKLLEESADGRVALSDALAAGKQLRSEGIRDGSINDPNPNLSVEWREATIAALKGLRPRLDKFNAEKSQLQTWASKSMMKEIKAYKYLSRQGEYSEGTPRTKYERHKEFQRAENEYVRQKLYGDETQLGIDPKTGAPIESQGLSGGTLEDTATLVKRMKPEDFMELTSAKGAAADATVEIVNKAMKQLDPDKPRKTPINKEAQRLADELGEEVDRYLKNRAAMAETGKIDEKALLKGVKNHEDLIKQGIEQTKLTFGKVFKTRLDTPVKDRLIDIKSLNRRYKLNKAGTKVINGKQLGAQMLEEHGLKMSKVREDFKREHRVFIDKLFKDEDTSFADELIRREKHSILEGIFSDIRDVDFQRIAAEDRIAELKSMRRKLLRAAEGRAGDAVDTGSAVIDEVTGFRIGTTDRASIEFRASKAATSKEQARVKRILKKPLEKRTAEETKFIRDLDAKYKRIELSQERLEEITGELERLQFAVDGPETLRGLLELRYRQADGDFAKFMASLSTLHRQRVINELIAKYDLRPELAEAFIIRDASIDSVRPFVLEAFKKVSKEDLAAAVGGRMTPRALAKKYKISKLTGMGKYKTHKLVDPDTGKPIIDKKTGKQKKERDEIITPERGQKLAVGEVASLIRHRRLNNQMDNIGEDLVIKDFQADQAMVKKFNAREKNISWGSKTIRTKAHKHIVPTRRAIQRAVDAEFGGAKINKKWVERNTGVTHEEAIGYLMDKQRITPAAGGGIAEIMPARHPKFAEGHLEFDPRTNRAITGSLSPKKISESQMFDASGNIRDEFAFSRDNLDVQASDIIARDIEMNQIEEISLVIRGRDFSNRTFQGTGVALLDRIRRVPDPQQKAVLLSRYRVDGSDNIVSKTLSEPSESSYGFFAHTNKPRSFEEVALDVYGSKSPADVIRAKRVFKKAEDALRKVLKKEKVERPTKTAEARGKALVGDHELDTYIQGIKNRIYDRDRILDAIEQDLLMRHKRTGVKGMIDEMSYVLKKFIDADERFADLGERLDELRSFKLLINRYGDEAVSEAMEDMKGALMFQGAGHLKMSEVFPFLKDPVALTKHIEEVAQSKLIPASRLELDDVWELADNRAVVELIQNAAASNLKSSRRRLFELGDKAKHKPMTSMDELAIDNPDAHKAIKDAEANIKKCMAGEEYEKAAMPPSKQHLTNKKKYGTEKGKLPKTMDVGLPVQKVGRGTTDTPVSYDHLTPKQIDDQIEILKRLKKEKKI